MSRLRLHTISSNLAEMVIDTAKGLRSLIRRSFCKHNWLIRYEEDYCPRCEWHRWH